MSLRLFSRHAVSNTGYLTRRVCCIPSIHLNGVQYSDEVQLKKTVKVAILGRPNAGKSTLVNAVMGLNICAASRKPHTTRNSQRVFYVHNDTQIILLDTPGITSECDIKKYMLNKESDVFTIPDIKTADVVGLLIDVTSFRKTIDHLTKRLLTALPQTAELILILNKIDRLKKKQKLLDVVDVFFNKDLRSDENWKNVKFSRAFMISALRNDGVKDLVEYIYSIAPNNTQVYTGQKSNLDAPTLIQNRVKAALLEYFAYETPYMCCCETEFIHENQLGEMHVIVTIKCSTPRHHNKITSDKEALAKVKKDCQKDLTKIFEKNVFIVPQVTFSEKKEKKTKIVN